MSHSDNNLPNDPDPHEIIDAQIVADESEPTRSTTQFFENRLSTGEPQTVDSLERQTNPDSAEISQLHPQTTHTEEAELIFDSELVTDATSLETVPRSWVFRVFGWLAWFMSRLFGMASVVFLLAVAANIPIVQFLSFGYLLEVSGRLARKQKIGNALIGLKKASVLGGAVLGAWLMLFPVRFVSKLWYDAYLIDPSSNQTLVMRVVQIALIGLVVAHICSAWFCGGKLRYFFWPLIAPFGFAIWIARIVAGSPAFKKILSIAVGWISPLLVDDICNVKPIRDWFLPAITWKKLRNGNLYVDARDRVWDFVLNLNLGYYFQLGFWGFVGTLLWLLVPTTLLVTASYTEGGLAVLTGIFGVIFAIPIFMLLPFLQAHFAKDGQVKRFLEVRSLFRNYTHAPMAHLSALFLTLLLALPLFFLKIEEIPQELLWTLSVVFVLFSWPARLLIGLAYRRAAKKEKKSRWWLSYPTIMLGMPIALAFALILTLTRYVSWNGALSLFENHVFLLPAPFWM